jgi:hypothetical protein
LTGISAGPFESQSLTVTAVSDNPGLIPNPTVNYTSPAATGSLSYTPVTNQFGSATITVTVMDDGGTSDNGVNIFTRTFLVVVVSVNNNPPIIDPISDQNMVEGGTLAFTVNASDPDAIDTLTFSLVSPPAGASINPNTGLFTYTPTDNGIVSITVRVDDDGIPPQSAQRSFQVNVSNANPTATFSNNGPVLEGGTATVSFSNVADPSTADVTAGFLYSYDFNNDGDFTDPGEAAGLTTPDSTVAFENSGIYTVRGRIQDQDGGFTDYTTTVTVTNADLIVTGFDKGGPARVRGVDADSLVEQFNFLAYDAAFVGGVRVAVGNVNGDGVPDIITAPGAGGQLAKGTLDVKVFDGITRQPLSGVLGGFRPFGDTFNKGIYVAAGDVNGDGFSDIIVAPTTGFNPEVKVYSGLNGTVLYNIVAFPLTSAFKKGVRVAAGDVTGDGKDDIIATAGAGATAQVKVFDGATGSDVGGAFANLIPFLDVAAMKAGLFVAAGDVNGDGKADIIVSVLKGAPVLRVFNGVTGQQIGSLSPAEAPGYVGGIRVATGDVNGDGILDIITSTAKAKGLLPHVRILNGQTLVQIDEFFADPTSVFKGGVFVGGGR